jgi:outer membrane immunogenic protein
MKKFLIAAAGLVALATPALAADMAPAPVYSKAPAVVVAPVINWTGFYVGAEGGYGWGRDRLSFPTAGTTTGRFDTSGGIAGGVVGYNWQASNWVFGVEGNFDWADIKGSTTCPNAALFCRTDLNEIFSGTGRIGYAWNSVLLYGKGGYAWTNDRFQAGTTTNGVITELTPWVGRSGWTAGAGFEWMFMPNWSAKFEYDYYNFSSKATNTVAATTGTFVELATLQRYSVNAVKAGINYHFNWGNPVVGRY